VAAADYRLCDVCGRKTFYDASLDEDYTDHIGDWAVICELCANRFKTVVVPRSLTVDTTEVEAAQRATDRSGGIVTDRAKTVSLLEAWLLEDAHATEDSLESLKSGLDGNRESSRKLFSCGGDDA